MFSSFATLQDEGYSEDPLTVRTVPRDGDAQVPQWMGRLSEQERARMAIALIQQLPTKMVAEIYEQLRPRLCLDFIKRLPTEVCLKILSYLDPSTLISVALSSRAAQSLAFDWKLWSHLYYLEGWKTLPGEVEAFQHELNTRDLQLQRTRSYDSEDEDTQPRAGKRRATPNLVSSPKLNRMTDVDMVNTDDSPDTRTQPIFISELPTIQPDMNDKSTPWYKHAQQTSDPEPMDVQSDHREIALPEIANLVTIDHDTGHQRLNWRNLYTQRRRLEANWDAGRCVNFQIPHPLYMNEAHSECIYTVQFRGRYLASGSRDKSLRIWDMETRRLALPPLIGHTGSVLCVQFDASPEEDLIVSGSSDASVILWRFSTGQAIRNLKYAHTEPVLNVQFDQRILVTCSKDRLIKIYNRHDLRPGETGYPSHPADSAPVAIVLGNFGHNPSPRDDLAILPPYTLIGTLLGHGAAVNAIQILDNEVVSASGDRQLRLWDWPSQRCLKSFIGHTKGIACVQYDGRRIVSGSSDNEVKVFDRESGLEIASLKGHSNLVRTVQAGFGDLPDSVEKDSLLAEEVDRQFFRALKNGSLNRLLPMNPRQRNAGSMQPEHIMAYGAKLPPGGGGGSYARIVSGSYDESVILWRRDRHGAWQPRYTFRQEDAARAALTAVDNVSATLAPYTSPSAPTRKLMSACVFDPQLPKTDPFFDQFVDKAVRAGPAPLRQLLKSYPTIFESPQLRPTIEMEPDPLVKVQLKIAYDEERTAAVVAGRIPPAQKTPLYGLARTYSVRPSPYPSHSQYAARHTSYAGTSSSLPPLNYIVPSLPRHSRGPPLQINNDSPSDDDNDNEIPIHLSHSIPPPLLPVTTPQTHISYAPPIPHGPSHSPTRPPPEPSTTARIFKLQFDARRIVCCSQTNLIVGWDFACGDEKIIEACRFFAGID